MEIGRAFTAQEDVPKGPKVVVISDGLWRRRFGADRNLLGKAFLLGGEPHVVVGVLAPGFDIDLNSDVWLPFRMNPNSSDLNSGAHAAARLRHGATLEMAKAQTRVAEGQFRRKFPGALLSQWSFDLETMREAVP
jgi:putative ABC transport system permease protein